MGSQVVHWTKKALEGYFWHCGDKIDVISFAYVSRNQIFVMMRIETSVKIGPSLLAIKTDGIDTHCLVPSGTRLEQ